MYRPTIKPIVQIYDHMIVLLKILYTARNTPEAYSHKYMHE